MTVKIDHVNGIAIELSNVYEISQDKNRVIFHVRGMKAQWFLTKNIIIRYITL